MTCATIVEAMATYPHPAMYQTRFIRHPVIDVTDFLHQGCRPALRPLHTPGLTAGRRSRRTHGSAP
jgi:hypothetical protein